MIDGFLNTANSLYQFALSCQAACGTAFVSASSQVAHVAAYVTSPTGITLVVAAVALATLVYIVHSRYAHRSQESTTPEPSPAVHSTHPNVPRTPEAAAPLTSGNLSPETRLREAAVPGGLVNPPPEMLLNPSLDTTPSDEALSELDERTEDEATPAELTPLDSQPLATAPSNEATSGLDELTEDETTPVELTPLDSQPLATAPSNEATSGLDELTEDETTPVELTPLDSQPLATAPLGEATSGLDELTEDEATPAELTPLDNQPLATAPSNEATSGLDELTEDETTPVELTPLDSQPLATAPLGEATSGLDELTEDEATPAELTPLDNQPLATAPLGEATSGLDELTEDEATPAELTPLDNQPLATAPLGEATSGLDELTEDEAGPTEPPSHVGTEMRRLIIEDMPSTVLTFGNRDVELSPSLPSRPQTTEDPPTVTIVDPLTNSQISYQTDAPEIDATTPTKEIKIDEPLARLKLVPADPDRKSWQVAQAVTGIAKTALSTTGNYLWNINRKLPDDNPGRPNLLPAIRLLRSGAFLGASVFEEVATELESKYPHLKIAVEGAKTECRLTLPDLEEGKTLYAIPLVLEGRINHMVTFVIDTERNQIEYFDPKGHTILDNEGIRLYKEDRPELFEVYFAILQKYGNPATSVFENRLPHQRDVNNCGAFVLRYITNRAKRIQAQALQNTYARESIWTFREELDEMLCSVAPATLPAYDGPEDFDFPKDMEESSSRPESPLGYTSTPLELAALQDALDGLE